MPSLQSIELDYTTYSTEDPKREEKYFFELEFFSGTKLAVKLVGIFGAWKLSVSQGVR